MIQTSVAMSQDQLPEFHDMNTSHSGALSKDEVILQMQCPQLKQQSLVHPVM